MEKRRLPIYISEDEFSYVEEQAAKNGHSISSYIRFLIQSDMKNGGALNMLDIKVTKLLQLMDIQYKKTQNILDITNYNALVNEIHHSEDDIRPRVAKEFTSNILNVSNTVMKDELDKIRNR